MKSKKAEEKEAERFKRAVYLLAIFILLLLFSRLALYFFGKGSGIEKCKGIVFQSFRDDCFQKLATQTGNISICNFTTNKDNCLTSIAISQRNISICNVVGIGCVTSLVSLVSQNECLKLIGNLKDYCLLEKALDTTNNSICNLIQNITTKEFCKKTILQKQIATSKNFSICENLSGYEKLICLQTIAKNLNTSIPQEYLPSFNYSKSYYSNLSSLNITNLLALVGNLSLVSQAISSKNVSICSTLPINQSSFCYLAFALNTTNVSVCNYLPQDKVNTCKQIVSFYISKRV
jgi:hypothetical protein